MENFGGKLKCSRRLIFRFFGVSTENKFNSIGFHCVYLVPIPYFHFHAFFFFKFNSHEFSRCTLDCSQILVVIGTQQTKTPNNAFHCPIFALMLGIIIGTIPMFHCHYWYFYFYPILVTVLGRSAQYW
jgi:hypothetical protein